MADVLKSEGDASELLAQERQDRQAPFGRLLVLDVVAQQLPAVRMPQLGVDARQLAIHDVPPGHRRRAVPQPGQRQVGAGRSVR